MWSTTIKLQRLQQMKMVLPSMIVLVEVVMPLSMGMHMGSCYGRHRYTLSRSHQMISLLEAQAQAEDETKTETPVQASVGVRMKRCPTPTGGRS
jgi:hypothetical protein